MSKKEIGSAYRYIGRNTDIRILPAAPEDHIERFTEKLDLSDDVKETARDLLERGREKDIFSGKSPSGLAASVIYLASYMEGEKRSMNEISQMLDVTTITIRNRSRDFVKALDLENVPENLLEHMD